MAFINPYKYRIASDWDQFDPSLGTFWNSCYKIKKKTKISKENSTAFFFP